MAKANYYLVYIERNSDVTREQVEKVMDLANDWYRIRRNVWILYSTSDSEKWYGRLAPLTKKSGSVLICQLNIEDSQGWMTGKFWEWLRRVEE